MFDQILNQKKNYAQISRNLKEKIFIDKIAKIQRNFLEYIDKY